ncbi:RHS repeat domain-containing protein, partial [Mesonia sp. K4-1]|uniref:RHS repeat domain-containing protein n=1 Tax=Mesonia sp. K4-1 TaxID=2602760 RepID=UPI0011C87044
LSISDDQKSFLQLETLTVNNGNTVASPNTNWRYQYDNHLGSACLELDKAAAVISYEEYYPFGTTSYRSGKSQSEVKLKRYRYCGKERDDETGFYYYGARYYAAWIGRFISIDPLAEKFPQLTPYNYAGNKPVTGKDLEGLQSTGDKFVDTVATGKSTYESNKRINDSDRRNTKDYDSFKEIDLDYAERKLNSLVDKARDNDYDFAADNLEHFLGNTGEDRIIHKNEVLADINMRNLIRENLRKIWVNKITPDSENLEIGESKSFDNYYIDSTNALLFSDNYYASGGSTIKTTAK